jgi:hypothetical protein
MKIAADYIREYCPDEEMIYDEAECDGSCIADDLDSIREDIQEEFLQDKKINN